MVYKYVVYYIVDKHKYIQSIFSTMIYSTSHILVHVDRTFKGSILPHIDLEARKQGKRRADVMREILYSKFGYQPQERSEEQLTYDRRVEDQYNTEGYRADTLARTPSLWICVDRDFLDIFMESMISKTTDDDAKLEKTYWKESRDIIQEHFFPVSPEYTVGS